MSKLNLTNFELETERLRLIPVNQDYAQTIFNEFTEEVTQHLLFRTTGKIEDTINYINTCGQDHQSGKSLHCVNLDKQTGEFLGNVSLRNLDTTTPDFGLWFKKSAQRKGYAFEACMALIDWARQNIAIEYIIYDPFQINEASNALAKKLGGQFSGTKQVTNNRGEEYTENIYHIY